MKKPLLIVILVLAIFQMVVLATDIVIGNPAIDRAYSLASGTTFIAKNNPANASGKITTVELYILNELANCEIGNEDIICGVNQP